MYQQAGKNDKYPQTIETWRKGDKVPEWLSDICKVTFVDGNGDITLESRETSTGGYELISSTGNETVIKTINSNDYVCRGDNGKIFSLTQIQLDLLYVNI